MRFRDLTGEQARQYADTSQVFEEWRLTARQMWNGHGGAYTANVRWEKNKTGAEYLVQRKNNIKKSLGRRTRDLERFHDEYNKEKARLIEREKSLRVELKRMAPINRAMLLGRVPGVVADILRKFDEQGFLGTKVAVIGTNALYAYEALCAVHIQSAVLATRDADFLWDSASRLQLAIAEVRPPSVIGLIRRADRSFDAGAGYGYLARNDAGFEVEMLTPSEEEGDALPLGLSEDDLQATPYRGLQALQVLEKTSAVAIDERGMPVQMVVPEIRSFALHKEWVASRADRKALSKGRDRDQAKIVRRLAEKHLGLSFGAPEMARVTEQLDRMS